MGWPIAMAPPSTLSLPRSRRPKARSSPKCVLQYSSLSQAARHPSTCAAKASLISTASMSSQARRFLCSIGVIACTGPSPISAGSSAPQFASTMRPSDFSPYSSTTSSAAMTSIAAPSVICELLPGVTLP